MNLHPYLGYVNGKRARINRFGFAGPEPLLKKSDDKIIIGITGGSVAASLAARCIGWASRNSVDLIPGKAVEFISLAIPGYKQPQQLLALDYLLTLGAEFDIIINLDGYNEITLPYTENIPAKIHPVFPRAWQLYSQKGFNPEIALQLSRIEQIRSDRQYKQQFIFQSILQYSRFCLLIWEVMDRRLENKLYQADSTLREILAKIENAENSRGPFLPYASDEAIWRDLVNIWKKASLQMAKTCQANGIAYYHFLQPNQYYEGSKLLSDEEKNIAYIKGPQPRKIAVSNGYPLMVEAGKELLAEGVRFIDLTLVFKNEARTVYADNCCHFNQLGYRVMGTEIFEVIKSDYLTE